MKKNILMLITMFIVMHTFYACSEDEPAIDNKNEMIEIVENTTTDLKYTVALYATDTLFEGYNVLYFKVTDNTTKQDVENISVSFNARMVMTTMWHSAPVEQPSASVNEDGYYEGAIVFLMPDNADEKWYLDITIMAGTEKSESTLEMPVVKSLDEARKINAISKTDSAKYFISLIEPQKPVVGVNDLELSVHYKQSMMSFPAVEDLTILFEPEMPSMDHGSPNNVDPVHIENGHYSGEVNFTMTGWWRLNLTILKNDDTVAQGVYFDVTF